MNSGGAKRMLKAVEETTGYRVVVDTVEGISEEAQMISARPEMPVHTIRVNKQRLAFAEYIVAVQCAMILRLWSDPARIPVFSPNAEKVRYLAGRLEKSGGLKKLEPRKAQQMATGLVSGLMNQLRSMPLEILVTRDCYQECPDLQNLQAQSMDLQLRNLSQNFTPELRSSIPEEIWRQSVSMTSALALNWSEFQGSMLPMLVYESAGFDRIGHQLLGVILERPERTSSAYTQVVDAWAGHLSLKHLYTWDYRNGKE